MKSRLPWLAFALVVALPLGALSDPIKISESQEVERGSFVCTIWVEPAGDRYEWTDVCGAEVDEDGDGDIDLRFGRVSRTLCQGNDPAQGSFCDGGEIIAEGNVTASELSIDLAGGSGSLHADLGACRIDLDWTATADAETHSGESLPEISPYAAPPTIAIHLRSRATTATVREASMAGSVCTAAEVSGAPWGSFFVDYTDADRTKRITVDPTA